MRIREACERDAGDVSRLLAELGYSVDTAVVIERLRAQDEFVLAADEGGAVIGLAALASSRTLTHAKPVGRLTALVVGADQRRRGVAGLLITAALQWAEQVGCEGLELTSGLRPERDAAHAFYLARGFERTSYRYWMPVGSG